MPLEKPGDVTGANQHVRKEQRVGVGTLQTLTDRVALSGAGRTTQQAADKLARADLHPNLDTFAACKWGNI